LLEGAPDPQDLDDLEERAQRLDSKILLRLGGTNLCFEHLNHLARVEDQGEELLELFGRHFILEKALDQRTQSARCVVNHVTKLSIFAMDVADDVDCSFGESKFS